jgi:hypothetical protein
MKEKEKKRKKMRMEVNSHITLGCSQSPGEGLGELPSHPYKKKK